MPDAIEMLALFDAHLHLRQDDLPGEMRALTQRVAHYSGRSCDQVIAMPNTKPPIHSPESIIGMREMYEKAMMYPTKVHMTAKWLPHTTPADVIAAKGAGAVGFKLYPQGATTNSDDGIPWQSMLEMPQQMQDVLGELEHQDMVLLCHGEAPGFVLDREDLFLPWFRSVSDAYPRLRMTMEHMTTKAAASMVESLAEKGRRVLGTITLHHTMTTLDDVIGGKLQPDLFCMPIPKREEDRRYLLSCARGGFDYYAFGSDSAPHDQAIKYCRGGCAGVFSAPVLAQSLLELFQEDVPALEKFAVHSGLAFYGLQHSGRKITLTRDRYVAPMTAGRIASFRGGEALQWRLGW